MVISAVIISVLLCLSLSTIYFFERVLGFIMMKQRLDRHDCMNALLVASGNLELGNKIGAKMALKDIQSIFEGVYRDNVINIGKLLTLISQALTYDGKNNIAVWSHDLKKIKIKSDLTMVGRVLTNLLKNAVEGSIDGNVTVKGENGKVYISNKATKKDRDIVKKDLGSSKSRDRGIGRRSTSQLMRAINCDVDYNIKEEVITAIVDFRKLIQ